MKRGNKKLASVVLGTALMSASPIIASAGMSGGSCGGKGKCGNMKKDMKKGSCGDMKDKMKKGSCGDMKDKMKKGSCGDMKKGSCGGKK